MQEVIAILNDIRPGEDFSGTDDFFAKGVLDSLDLTTLVAAIEGRYNVFIDVEEMIPENFRNLAAIRAVLGRHGVSI
jgi:acyl carrier protein